jgi:putative ABC transport system permease protein
MLINHLRVILRHLGRKKLNTALLIIGLTLGMSVCLLIGLFLRYELSFDTYHEKSDRTYRINSVFTDNMGEHFHYSVPLALAEELKSSVTGLEHVALAVPTRDNIIEINPQRRFIQEHVLVVNEEFPQVFKVEEREGNLRETLRKPYQAALTESTAKKFFGNEVPIGKVFRFKNKYDITVTSVIRDLPSNTHLPATLFLSYVADPEFLSVEPDAWTYVSGTSVFVTLPDAFDINSLRTRLSAIADAKINPSMPESMRGSFDIQPLGSIHFEAKYNGGGEWVSSVNKSWLWIFAAIGFAVLVLACINFVNLSTAQALTRAREIGVRKSIGARKANLIAQFVLEAGVLATFAAILSVAFVQVSLPFMNRLLEKGITFNLAESPLLLLSLCIGVLITVLMAGLYPAFVIARFNPVVTLKSSTHTDHGSPWLRTSLLVTQFTISAGLVIVVFLMARQLNFLRSQDLGFNKDNIVYCEFKDISKANTFVAELERLPQIKDISFSSATPTSRNHWGTGVSMSGINDPKRASATLILADDHYCTMYGLKLLSGRFPVAADTNSVASAVPEEKRVHKVVVNEKLVETLGFASNEEAVGKMFTTGFAWSRSEIIGVVANFNTASLHDAVKPTFITPGKWYQIAGIKIEAASSIPETIAAIEAAWKKNFPDGVFDYKFLDDQIDAYYKSEERLYTLFKTFAGLAMLISCIGLWGLSTYTAQQRTKEIGIRKVLGATVSSIVALLSREFLVIVLVALTMASPLSFYFMRDWLQTFAFHIEIDWKVFVIAGLSTMSIALFTVGIRAIKAATANPVDSLRNE